MLWPVLIIDNIGTAAVYAAIGSRRTYAWIAKVAFCGNAEVVSCPALAPDVAASVQRTRIEAREPVLASTYRWLRARDRRTANRAVHCCRHGRVPATQTDAQSELQAAAAAVKAPGRDLVEVVNLSRIETILHGNGGT